MPNPLCANEADYHQRVINYIGGFPDILKSRSGLHVLVWGHEVTLHDAGRNRGNGSADLLTVDEEGMVWLIEVKFLYTSESGSSVWGDQLRRYRQAIKTMEWQEILSYTENFLKGNERTKPALPIPASVKTFTDVLEIWHKRVGRALLSPIELTDRIATRLKDGTYGIMVLTDFYDASYEKFGKAFEHRGPLAYVQGEPTGKGMNYHVQWRRPAAGDASPDLYSSTWTSTFRAPQLRCSPKTFEHSLCDGARALWCDLLKPRLIELGGRFTAGNRMSFEAEFSIGGARASLLRIGWSERDAINVAREEKRAGTAAMKINPRIKNIYKVSGDIDVTNKWMTRFHCLGWRGRPSEGPGITNSSTPGTRKDRWGVVPVTGEELNSENEGIMQYTPDDDTRDHNGRPGDRESLEGLLNAYSELLDDLRKIHHAVHRLPPGSLSAGWIRPRP